jgi:hypothetical protein
MLRTRFNRDLLPHLLVLATALSLVLLAAILGAAPAAAEQVIGAWRAGGFDRPVSVSVNPTDGSCWVANEWNHQVVHLVIQRRVGAPQ